MDLDNMVDDILEFAAKFRVPDTFDAQLDCLKKVIKMFTFDELSREARNYELELDELITELSKLCAGNDHLSKHRSSVTQPLLPKEDLVKSTSDQIQSHLNELSKIHNSFEQVHYGPNGFSSIQQHILQRHREIFEDYSSDFKKILENYKHQKQKNELLSSVDHDIDIQKGSYNRRLEMYIKENDHLQSSSRLIDDQINIAVETRDQLISQRLSMKRLQTRLHDIASRFPVVNSLVQRINFHKRRDSIIIGLIVFVCTLLLLSYAFH